MFSYIINLYHRAIANKKLTMRERASLKAFQGFVIGFIITAAPQIIAIYTAHGKFNITPDVLGGLFLAFILGLLKLWGGQGDSQLGDILDTYATALETKSVNSMVDQSTSDGIQIPTLQLLIPSQKPVASFITLPAATKTVSPPDLPSQDRQLPASNLPQGGSAIASVPQADPAWIETPRKPTITLPSGTGMASVVTPDTSASALQQANASTGGDVPAVPAVPATGRRRSAQFIPPVVTPHIADIITGDMPAVTPPPE